MSNTRIPSPARSVGNARTPRRYMKRGTRSVGSPAHSDGPSRLTLVIKSSRHTSPIPSPLPSRCSLLTDSTYIEQPKNKNWWQKIDENCKDVLDLLESQKIGETNNVIEELIHMDVLSQEKKEHLSDLPESSDNESIHSIILPQRKLFKQKEVQPAKNFGQLIGNRESLAKLRKTNSGPEITVTAGTRDLFQNNKKQTKPIFPAALLAVSINKTTEDTVKDVYKEVSEVQVRNIFGKHPPVKRKNMFTDFIISESEDEIPEIKSKKVEFPKSIKEIPRGNITQHIKERLSASSVTTDMEMEDWLHLPSSTMVDQQIEEINIVTTTAPLKTPKLSKLSEGQESELHTVSVSPAEGSKHSNESAISQKVSNNKKTSYQNNHMSIRNNSSMVNKNTSKNISLNPVPLDEPSEKKTDKANRTHNQSLQHNTSIDAVIGEYNPKIIENSDTLQEMHQSTNNETFNRNNKENIILTDENDLMVQENITADENNFSLVYEEDDIQLPNDQNKADEKNNISVIQKSTHLETNKAAVPSMVMDINENDKPRGCMDNEFKQLEQNEHDNVGHHCNEIKNLTEADDVNKNNENQVNIVIVTDNHGNNDEIIHNIQQSKEHQSTTMVRPVDELDKDIAIKVSDNIENAVIQFEAKGVNNSIDNLEKIDQELVDNDELQKHDKSEDSQNDHDTISKDIGENQSEIVEEDIQTIDIHTKDSDTNEEEQNENNTLEESLQIHNQSHEDSEKDETDNEVQNDTAILSNENSEVDENPLNDDLSDDDAQDCEEVNQSSNIENDDVNNDQNSGNDQDSDNKQNSDNGQHSNNDHNSDNDQDNPDSAVQEQEINDVTDYAKSPEVILHDKTNKMDSFTGKGRNTSIRKSIMLKSLHIRPSVPTVRDSAGFSDGTKNSSAEASAWDSHRTTRKTLRQTFGKDFSPRKSLRTLVMEKSAKRQTAHTETHSESMNLPRANSTEFPENSDHYYNDESVEQSAHEMSKRTRQATLEMYLQKIQKKNMEMREEMEENVKNLLKRLPAQTNQFKVPKRPLLGNKHPFNSKEKKANVKQTKSLIPLENLPPELLEDMKYKPPKRFKPSNASWITKRLYNYLENKLETRYDYKARVRAEKLVETIYFFTKSIGRHETAPLGAVQALKHEMARLDIVKTHFEFYNFFHEFMPREIRVKVIPDIVNKIEMPKHGIFSDIITGQAV